MNLILDILYWLPYYFVLVLVPGMLKALIDRVLGLDMEEHQSISLEEAWTSVALAVFFYPLFEELIFRGIPFILFGLSGLVVGSIVWIIMHPAWQIHLLPPTTPLWKKLVFLTETILYYTSNAVFYGMVWAANQGLIAIIYHMLHNGWITLAEIVYKARAREEPKQFLPRFVSPVEPATREKHFRFVKALNEAGEEER